MSGNPKATPNVATPSKRRAIHGKDRSLAARGTAWGVICAVRVCGDSPYRVRTLEREKSLRDVRLDERYTARFSDKRDELEEMNDPMLLDRNDGQRMWNDAHPNRRWKACCTGPSNRLTCRTLSRPLYVTPPSSEWFGTAKNWYHALESFRLIGIPCNGPFSFPVLAK